MQSKRQSNVRGFTLIEVAVALAVLALMLGAVYETFQRSLRSSGQLRERETAMLAAQSVLAALRANGRFDVGASKGATPDGTQWESSVAVFPVEIENQSAMGAYEVTVTVQWGRHDERQLTLKSIEWGRRT